MPKKIDPEVQTKAARLVADHVGEYPSLTAASARSPSKSVSAPRLCAAESCRPRSTVVSAMAPWPRSRLRSRNSRPRTGGCETTWKSYVRERISSWGIRPPTGPDSSRIWLVGTLKAPATSRGPTWKNQSFVTCPTGWLHCCAMNFVPSLEGFTSYQDRIPPSSVLAEIVLILHCGRRQVYPWNRSLSNPWDRIFR